jgi:hypothetical protein
METIKGIDAIRLAQEISKLPDGTFNVYFYPCNLQSGDVSPKLQVIEGCKTRAQLPQEKWEADGDTYFLFSDAAGQPKTSHRILTRFMAFPPNFELRKIEWLK